MAQIKVKFDNNIKQSDIIVPLMHSSVEESGKNYVDNQPEIQQTSVHGIMSPLIMINKIVIDFDSIIEFSLKSQGPLPTLTMIVRDKFNLVSTLNSPGVDNEVRVQILPQFEKAYKKINLTFYISNINISGGGSIINITGQYKLGNLQSSRFKAFGEISTFELFEQLAKETGLGFATNVEGSQDSRYIYCDNKSYVELMSKEIMHSGGKTQVYDYWVDFWNNINFADIKERYEAIDEDKDLTIWVSGQTGEVTEGNHVTPVETLALLNNHPTYNRLELAVKRYNVKNKLGSQLSQGTDKLYSIYDNNKLEYMDYLIQDGDVKKDIYTKYDYLGEVYGDYDYLLSEKKRVAFLQKINTESIEVVTSTPLFALMRGHKVNFAWYRNDSLLNDKISNLNDNGLINDVKINIPLEDTNPKETDDVFKLDKAVSGQYLITGCDIRFSNNNWEYILTLNKPASSKTNILKDE